MTDEVRSLAMDLIEDEMETLRIAKAQVKTAKNVKDIPGFMPWYLKKELETEFPEEE